MGQALMHRFGGTQVRLVGTNARSASIPTTKKGKLVGLVGCDKSEVNGKVGLVALRRVGNLNR